MAIPDSTLENNSLPLALSPPLMQITSSATPFKFPAASRGWVSPQGGAFLGPASALFGPPLTLIVIPTSPSLASSLCYKLTWFLGNLHSISILISMDQYVSVDRPSVII